MKNSSAAGAAHLVAGHSPGPWLAANMVHADRGDAMTPEEIGAYVAASIRKSIEDGGSADRFLFITTNEENAPDICHVGNGPRGPANARLIAAAPDLLEALEACAESLAFARDKLGMCGEGDGADRKADADDTIGSLPALLAARAAITKAGGDASRT